MDHRYRVGFLDHLANCTFRVATLSGSRGEAEEALRLIQAVVDKAPEGDWCYQMYFTILGNGHFHTHDSSLKVEDTNESIKFGRLTLYQWAKE